MQYAESRIQPQYAGKARGDTINFNQGGKQSLNILDSMDLGISRIEHFGEQDTLFGG